MILILSFFIKEVRDEQDENNEKDGRVNPSQDQFIPKLSGKVYVIDEAMWISTLNKRVALKILSIGSYVQYILLANDEREEAEVEGALNVVSQYGKLQEFNAANFETLIDRLRLPTSAKLTRLLVQVSGLFNHFMAMRRYYLLGHDEFFTWFLRLANNFNWSLQNVQSNPELEKIFRRASAQTVQPDSLIDYFKIGFSKIFLKEDKRVLIGSQIELTYRTEWPFAIIFHQSILQKYQLLFQLLLSVRTVQAMLQTTWTHHMFVRKAQGLDKNNTPLSNEQQQQQRQIYAWRALIGAFVDNLQMYLQSDIIDSQFGNFYEGLSGEQDVEMMKKSHDQFVERVFNFSFLGIGPVVQAIGEVLYYANLFAIISNRKQTDFGALSQAFESFQRVLAFLFWILSEMQGKSDNQYIGQFLFRLDFNHHFTKLFPKK